MLCPRCTKVELVAPEPLCRGCAAGAAEFHAEGATQTPQPLGGFDLPLKTATPGVESPTTPQRPAVRVDEEGLEVLVDEGDPITYVPRSGDVLANQFRLQHRLGQGGMAVVYLAEDLTLRRLVAVKFILGAGHQDQVMRSRFLREAQMMARLEHPNTLPVYFVGQHQGVPFLVAKYLEGRTVAQLIREEGALSPTRALRFLDQAARALDAMHARGLVHRDVKPSNLFVGEAEHLWVIDFGIAREVHNPSLTESGHTVGTALYASPEMLTAKEVDAASDQYALALVAHLMLSKELPFKAENEIERAQKKLRGLSEDQFGAHLPLGVREALAKALSPKPKERFATCSQFVEALRASLTASQPLQPLPPRPVSRVWLIPSVLVLSMLAVASAWKFLHQNRAPGPIIGTGTPGADSGPLAPQTTLTTDAGAVAAVLVEMTDGGNASPSDGGSSAAPGGGNTGAPDAGQRAGPVSVAPKFQRVTIQATLSGRPTYGNVSVSGKTCSLPCSLVLPRGRHVVRIVRDGYAGERKLTIPSSENPVVVPLIANKP